MPDAAVTSFHFLRPFWLVALLPVAVVLAVLLYGRSTRRRWGDVIAPHLLSHLIVAPKTWMPDPAYLVAAGLALATVALAGPTWRREMPPFVEDKAPLMIALALGSSMAMQDVAPSRLERAKQKISDLMHARAGARTGLIAYAGTAHLVMPMTEDSRVIKPFLAALSPTMMPTDGRNAAAAVTLAANVLATDTSAGTILLVADGLEGVQMPALRASAGPNGLLMLSVAPGGSSHVAPSGSVVHASVDRADIGALERRIETRFQTAEADRVGARWRDEGYWLLFPLGLLCLLWFRRGTTVQWVILLMVAFHVSPADAQDADAHRFRDLWLTPDQQGRLAFDHGEYAAASKLFADPMWRGISAYRAYDFLAAAAAFEHVATPEGQFALGNAQAHNHAFEKAIKAYDAVLKARPDHAAAKINKAIVEAALRRQEQKRKQTEEGQAPPGDLPDEVRVDPGHRGGKRIEVTPQDVTTASAAEAWLREVETSPAGFLKSKFAIQAASAQAPSEGGR
jgi:Ca-activated chloride channel homolog